MNSYNHKISKVNEISLLNEADELARSHEMTRDRALFIMYSQALDGGDNFKAKACMKLLEKEVMNSLTDPSFWRHERENDSGG